MAQQEYSIEVSVREAGRKLSSMRRNKIVPAVVYGPKIENMNLSLAENDAVRYNSHGFENSIFTLKSSDKNLNGLKVLKKAVAIHPVSRRPVHFDFFAPDMTKAVRVSVELRFEGKAIGTTEGGIFNAVRRDIEIECLPTEIPSFISVDVSNIGLDDSMHVSDIQIPSGIKLITSVEETIATVAVVKEEAAATPIAAATDAGAAPAAGAAAAPGAAAPAADAKASPAKKE